VIPFNPLLAYAAAGALAVGAIAGYKIRDWQCDAAVAKAFEKAEKQRKEMQDEVDQSARDYEAERDRAAGLQRATVREIRTIYESVPAPSPDCAAPDSVVGLLKGSVDSANASATGKSGE
jgi:hypothetical protein